MSRYIPHWQPTARDQGPSGSLLPCILRRIMSHHINSVDHGTFEALTNIHLIYSTPVFFEHTLSPVGGVLLVAYHW